MKQVKFFANPELGKLKPVVNQVGNVRQTDIRII